MAKRTGVFTGHLQTIMRFPPALNILRGTQFAWVLPFVWTMLTGAAVAAPTTIEVFLHHRFGGRSGKALLKGVSHTVCGVHAIIARRPSCRCPPFSWLSFCLCNRCRRSMAHQPESPCRTNPQSLKRRTMAVVAGASFCRNHDPAIF